jgi:hypothetical protein
VQPGRGQSGRRPRQGRRTLGVHPPGAGADRTDRRRFIRDLNARSAILTAVLLVVAIAARAAIWIVAMIGVSLLAVLIDVAWLTWRLANGRDRSA